MRLVFIYNAKSGLLNGALDFVHKIVSPDTYACSLCGLTYGPLGMKRAWADFVESLPVEVAFTYPDRMPALPDGQPLPALPVGVLVDKDNHKDNHKDNRCEILLSASDMNACTSLDELMARVTERLDTVRPPHPPRDAKP
ncbi:MAG: hypothetical protein RIE53_10720 [Rhodothermales bacterium]